MNWLFDVLDLNLPVLKEPLIDCDNCQIKKPLKRVEEYKPDRKCCEFSPFWSSFAIGAWLEAGNTLESLPAVKNGELLITSLGIMHTLEHRDSDHDLCLLFKKESNNCSVWAERPAICFSFYCASQYKDGIQHYSDLEDWMLSAEATLLQLDFKRSGLALNVWQRWIDFMELKPIEKQVPSEILLKDYKEAEKRYKDSYRWFRDSDDCALARGKINASWKKHLAGNPVVC